MFELVIGRVTVVAESCDLNEDGLSVTYGCIAIKSSVGSELHSHQLVAFSTELDRDHPVIQISDMGFDKLHLTTSVVTLL